MSTYWTAPQEIMLPCIQDKYFKFELLSGDHTFGYLISGEVKVIIADQTHILKPGDTWFCPRNQLATFIKYAKDGQSYRSVTISLRTERLKDYYTRHEVRPEPRQNCGIKYYDKHPLLDSFFGSLLPYFEMEEGIPIAANPRLKLNTPSPFFNFPEPVSQADSTINRVMGLFE